MQFESCKKPIRMGARMDIDGIFPDNARRAQLYPKYASEKSGNFLLTLPAKRRVQLIGYIILPVADRIFSQLHAEIRVGLATEGILRL